MGTQTPRNIPRKSKSVLFYITCYYCWTLRFSTLRLPTAQTVLNLNGKAKRTDEKMEWGENITPLPIMKTIINTVYYPTYIFFNYVLLRLTNHETYFITLTTLQRQTDRLTNLFFPAALLYLIRGKRSRPRTTCSAEASNS